MSIVTTSRPMWTTRPVTTSPAFGLFKLCSKRVPKSSSAPIFRSGFSVISGIKVLPPPGGIRSGAGATTALPYLRPPVVSRVKTKGFAGLGAPRHDAAAPHQALHLVDDARERQARRIERDRVRGGPERRVRARRIALVTGRELACERRLVDVLAL